MPSRTGRPWRRIVTRVIRRDHGICHICGGPGADSADHVVPVAKGGAVYDLANLRAVHHDVEPKCNRVRGARTIEQARSDVARVTAPAAGWSW